MKLKYEMATLGSITLETKDGDWGLDSPAEGFTPYRVIRGADFPNARKGGIASVPLRYLPERTVGNRTLQPNDIIIETAGGSSDRPTGRTLFVSKSLLGSLSAPSTCASFARFIRVDNSKADPRYIFWYLQNLHASGGMWEHQVQHTGVARFQYTRFASTHEIPLPPRNSQAAVADVLCVLDDKIAVNERIARTARDLARANFYARVESDDAEDVELSTIVEFLGRGVAPRYSEDDEQLMVLNQKCIRDGRVNVEPSRRTVSDKVPAAKLLQQYDVLVNSTGVGTLGRVAQWASGEACTVDSHVTIVRFDAAKVDPVCAGFAMLNAETEITNMGEGSTGQTELSRAKLSTLRIGLPSKDGAAQLRPVLDALESRGDRALEESRSLAELRDTLLPGLMSGEIKVKDAEKIVEDVT
jgi:type I restriction enzyme S subunit